MRSPAPVLVLDRAVLANQSTGRKHQSFATMTGFSLLFICLLAFQFTVFMRYIPHMLNTVGANNNYVLQQTHTIELQKIPASNYDLRGLKLTRRPAVRTLLAGVPS